MFCTKCGKQIGDYDALCSDCGQENKAVKSPLKKYVQPYESPVLSDIAFVLAVFAPIIGLLWAVIVGQNYKTSRYTSRCSAAIWVAIISGLAQMAFLFLAAWILSSRSTDPTQWTNLFSELIGKPFLELSTKVSEFLISKLIPGA